MTLKRVFWQAVFVVSLAIAGLLIGGYVGGTWFVGKGSGLAGGAIVLGYAVLGGLVFLVASILVARRLTGAALTRAALIVFAPTLVAFGWLVVANQKPAEPDSAFAPAGIFTATMERLDTSDPYLFTKMQIDSQARSWTQTGPAPDHEVYYAAMKAKSLVDIRAALNIVATLSATDHDDCKAAQGPAIKRLTWVFNDSPTGVIFPKAMLETSQACLNSHPAIARALYLIEKASSDPAGKVRKK